MNDSENFNTIKANKLCYKWKSKSTCLNNDCSAKHHTNISRQIKVIEIGQEDPKQNSNIKMEQDKIQSFTGMTKEPLKRVLMQILPVQVRTIHGGTTMIYALLDNGSESTLIRDDFKQGLKLKGYKKTISVLQTK